MAATNPPTLRKRAPFWCSHRDLTGKPTHLDYALSESDGDTCPIHAEERRLAEQRFFDAPIVPAIPKPAPEPEATVAWPIWPV